MALKLRTISLAHKSSKSSLIWTRAWHSLAISYLTLVLGESQRFKKSGLMTRAAIGIAAGVAGSLFIAYCFYFDRKRRSDPNFKQKLRARRAASRKLMEERATSSTRFPDINDTEAVQKFFIQEIQLGEELLGFGDLEGGVEHLTNAVSLCAQPQQLLQVLNQSLPPQIFDLIIERLSHLKPKMPSTTMVEDDVE